MEQSRRDFLKKSAVAGGIVWAVPAISSLPAGAQAAGTPCAGECTGGARGLVLDTAILNLALGADADPADTGANCAVAAQVGQVLGAGVICGEFADVGGSCTANAQVTAADANTSPVLPAFPVLVSFDLITSEASTSGACGATGTSTIVDLQVGADTILTDPIFVHANGAVAPNTTVSVNVLGLGLVTVVVNEQITSCVNGVSTLTVRGLHVTVTLLNALIAELIVAESVVGNSCCTC